MAGLGNGAAAAELEEALRIFSIFQDVGLLQLDYTVGYLCIGEHSPDSFAIAIIACVGSRYLVAVPSDAWARKVQDRKLPSSALEKPLLVQVAGCSFDNREQPAEHLQVTVWLGWLKAGLEAHVDFEAAVDPSYYFLSRSGEKCAPFGQALIDVACEKYQLQSVLNPQPLEARVAMMESRFGGLEAGMEEVLARLGGKPARAAESGFATAAEEPLDDDMEPSIAPAAKRASKKKQPAPMAPPPGLGNIHAYPGLDPTAVSAALQAGIPEHQLRTMSQLLGSKPKKLEDYPRPAQANGRVSEEDMEENELEDEGMLDQMGADPMAIAVTKLTAIVGQLASRKKEDPVEDALSGLSGGVGSAEGGASLGRKHAATRLALQKLLRDKPQELWRILESNMEEDFHLATSMPNTGALHFTVRGWAEHRSKIAGYPRTVRAVWGVAGIMDCLRNGMVDQARARCGLMMAQFEQESIDAGSYMLAQEYSLEPPPPIHAFQAHRIPDPMEQPATRLMCVNWVEAFTDKLKQIDNYMEVRRKLTTKAKPNPPGGDQKAKGEGKGKGKQKSKKVEKSDEAAE